MSLPREFATALALDKTLYNIVAETHENTFEDNYQLETAIKLARVVLADRMDAWVRNRSNPQVDANVRDVLARDFHQALHDYLDIVEKIARINKLVSENISVHSVFAVFRQVERIMDRELMRFASPEDAIRIKRLLQNEVVVPGFAGASEDVVEAPSAIASFMDESVPDSENVPA